MNGRGGPITIVIPTCNRREELARCLASCRKWMPDARILVVDDGGNDGTREMMRESFSGAEYLHYPENRGPAHARNRAIEAVDTPYIAFFDSDVLFLSDWCRAVRDRLSPDTVLAGRVQRPDGSLEWGPRKIMPWGGSRPCPPGKADAASSNNMLVPVEMARLLGGFSENLGIYFEDTFFCIRALRAGFKIRYADEAAVVHCHDSYLRPDRKRRFIRNRCRAMVSVAEKPRLMVMLQCMVTLGEIVLAAAGGRPDIAKACWGGMLAGMRDVLSGLDAKRETGGSSSGPKGGPPAVRTI